MELHTLLAGAALIVGVISIGLWIIRQATVKEMQTRELLLMGQLETERKDTWALRFELTNLMKRYIAGK